MSEFNYPSYFSFLKEAERDVVRDIISRLSKSGSVVGIRWGGSTTQLNRRAEWSDVDLWVLVRDAMEQEVKRIALDIAAQCTDLVFVLDGGYFDFFGYLVQFFFFNGCTFGVDVGICTRYMLQTVTPGSESVVVWGAWPNPEGEYARRIGSTAERRLSMILLNLIKVRKALHRGYLWNAIEYTSRARRQLMGLLIGDGPTTTIRYSRSDHSIEAVMCEEDLKALSITCPGYSQQEIARCATTVGRMSTKWADEQHILWAPLSQLKVVTEAIYITGRDGES